MNGQFRIKSVLIIFLLLLQTLSLRAQEIGADSLSVSENGGLFSNLRCDVNCALSDGARLFNAPLNWDSDDFIKLGVVAGTVGLAYWADQDVRHIAERNRSSAADKATEIGRYYGELNTGLVIAFGSYFGGEIFGSRGLSKTGRMLTETLLYAGIVTTVLKAVIGRSRPYMEEGRGKFRGFQFKTEKTSMPSGHATVAFSISSVLARRIDNIYASIGLYSLAGFTAVQRMYDNKHWLSDCVLGAAIGTAIGNAVAGYEEERGVKSSAGDGVKVSVVPAVYGGGFGLSLTLSW